ncbi:MAG: prepilin-type N-terminal cleavage/methylation domain-containing protein [Candidatus Sumerlaeia bacterium]|nr:prepilin-type N-terminal cleavage/methylation domain-containing protein [Candidatus Sumerlaeia bacterium]
MNTPATTSHQRRAFTLIELLIVVAIIAILAAIAVPNFLEAQTRAKVSAAKADMRTLATALEAYRVDNNKYVPTPTRLRSTGLGTDFLEDRWGYLTTPVAYITSIYADPFGDKDVQRSNILTTPSKYRTYDYSAFDRPEVSGLFENQFKTDLVTVFGYSDATLWIILSQGPDLTPGLSVVDPSLGTVTGRATGLPYDPTNGTISAGDITLTGPGGVVTGGA